MAALTYLVSAVLMGLAVVAVAAAISRGESWIQVRPGLTRERRSRLRSLASSPAVWALAFVVGTLAVGGATVLAVGGAIVGTQAPEGLEPVGIALIGVVAAVLIAFYVGYGSYRSAMARGLIKSQAAFVGAATLGLLALLVVTVKLLTAG